MDTLKVKQINLKLPQNLAMAAESYVKNFGFRNVQELVAVSIREKIFEKNEFDETINEKEINLIDNLIKKSIKEKELSTEEEMNKILLRR